MNSDTNSKWLKYGTTGILYVVAAVVVGLNITLMFDNVLWGDEAFSANMVRHDAKGMMQIIHFWDSHPPFYYFWLKFCSMILGYNSYVYHLASLIPYFGGVILALICFPKRFGHIPTAVFLIFTGLASECLTYNVEVRMYSISAFLVLCGLYAAYLIILENRRSAWLWMVVCGLCGAYSHLYVFMIMGLVIFFTSCAAYIRHGKPVIKRAVWAHICFVVGYGPWFYHLYQTMGRMVGSWWMTAPASLKETVNMIFGGESTRKFLMPVLALMIIAVLFLELQKKALRLNEYAAEVLFMLVGGAVIASTFVVAYGASYLIKPILARRYVYALTSVIVMLLAVTISYLIGHTEGRLQWKFFGKPENLTKGIFVLLCCVMFAVGLQNYKVFYEESMEQERRTQEVLSLIGDEPQYLISNGVNHLTWSVFGHYYPDVESIEAHHGAMTAADFWYFNTRPMTQEELKSMTDRGYQYEEHLDMVFVKYPCAIYHFYQ